MRRARCFLAVAACLTAVASPCWPASAFALRGIEPGGRAPDIDLAGVSGEGGKLSSFSGPKGLVVIFWATWSSRSPAILQFAEGELLRYGKLGMNVIAVNADHQEMKPGEVAAVREKARELGLTFPVLYDKGLVGYNAIGIISMPTTLILDNALVVKEAYPGFPSIARDDIPERIDAFLGIVREKRPESARYLLDHRPKNNALQYYNLGKRLFLAARSASGELHGGVPRAAIDRLDEAIRRDPDYFRPYLLKAIIYNAAKATGERDAALETIRKREFGEPYENRILALGYLLMGMDAEASDRLKVLFSISPDDPAGLFGQKVLSDRGKDPAGAKKAVAELERLLDLEKKAQGMIRSDAPVRP